MSEFVPENGIAPDQIAPDAGGEPEPQFQISQEDWNAMQENQGYLLDQLGQLAQSLQPQQGQLPPPPPDSLLAPDDIAYLQALYRAELQQQIAPLYEMRERYTQSEGSELARGMLDDELTRNGEFLIEGSNERALAIANNEYLPQMVARYGETLKAAEEAVKFAAQDVREWEQAVGQQYHERQMNQLRGISSAPRQPAAAGSAPIQPHVVPQGGDEMSVVDYYFGKRGG